MCVYSFLQKKCRKLNEKLMTLVTYGGWVGTGQKEWGNKNGAVEILYLVVL